MRRRVAVVAAVLLVVLLAVPGWLGVIAERSLLEAAETQPVPDHFELTVTSYERGWFTSRAVVEARPEEAYLEQWLSQMGMPREAASAELRRELEQFLREVTLRSEARIAHGPIGFHEGPFLALFKAVLRPDVDHDVAEEWRRRLEMPYWFEARIRGGFAGVLRFDAEVPAAEYHGDELELSFSGLRMQGQQEPRSATLEGEGVVDALQISAGGAHFRLESLRFGLDGRLARAHPLWGDFDVELERLELSGGAAGAPRLDLRGARARTRSDLSEDGGRLDTAFSYEAESFESDRIVLSDAQIEGTLANIDLAALRAYGELTQEALASEAHSETESLALRDILHRFLVASPRFELDTVRFRYEDEPFRGSMQLAIDGASLPPPAGLDLESAEHWMRLISGGAEVEVSRALGRMVALQITTRWLGDALALPFTHK